MVRTLTFFGLLCLALSGGLMAQSPSNDWVCGDIEVNPDACWEGTTLNGDDITPGQGVGADCQSHGNNIEVWYSFIANNTGFNFDVYHDTTMTNPSTGLPTTLTASSVDLILFRVSTYSNCDELAPCGDPTACDFDDLVGMACWEDDGTRDLAGQTSGLVVGQRYYFLVSSAVVSGETPGSFLVCFSNTPYVPPGDGCDEATTVCNSNSFTANGGDYSILQENLDAASCLGSYYDGTGGTNYNMPSRWYQFTFGTSGTFGFNLNPNPSTGDLDFALYNMAMTPCAANMGAPIGCNYSACAGVTGISAVLFNDCNGSPAYYNAIGDNCFPANANCTPAPSLIADAPSGLYNVVAGQTMTLYVGNFGNTSPNGFTVNFEGTAQIGPQAGFTVNSTTCNANGTMDVQVTANTVTPGYEYIWEMGDGSYYSGTTTTHNYAAYGEYAILLTVSDTNGTQNCLAATEALVACVLPVVFTSTEARIKTEGVEVTWSTPLDLPTDRFVVQYSSDLQNWFEAGKVYDGTPISQMRYKFMHPVTVSGNAWYRIVHFDEGGHQTASSILNVNSLTSDVRTLVRIVDTYGREVSKPVPGQMYIYQYSDGSTDKKVIVE